MKDEPGLSGDKDGNGNGELDEKTLLQFSLALKKGDFDARLPIELGGLQGKVADTLNDVAEMVGTLTTEVNRIGTVVGKEGRVQEEIDLKETGGSWGVISRSINTLIDDLSRPIVEISRVLESVAIGDLSQTIALEIEGTPVKGEFLRVSETVNTLVDKLNTFASEVTRVAKEVGTEGKLGGQAIVPNIAGTWKDLTDNFNFMANNLTEQVRGIVKVVTAVAEGDLEQKLSLAARGEVASLADTINGMTKTLATFADQVIGVAKEVGVEGRAGGGSGCCRYLEGPREQREHAGEQLDHTGKGHSRCRDSCHQRRPLAGDHCGGQGRSQRTQVQHEHHDHEPQDYHTAKRRAGLAEDEPRQVHCHAAGNERPRHCCTVAHVRACPGGELTARRLLHDGDRREQV